MKRTTILVFLLALSLSLAKEETKKSQKRGVFGENSSQEYDNLNVSHDSHSDVTNGYSLDGQNIESAQITNNIPTGPIDLGTTVHQHFTVTKKIGIPVPQPYPVRVEKKVPVAVPHPVPVAVDKPYPVHVPKPYPVAVEKPVPYPIEKKIPYPVKVQVKVPVKVPVPIPYPAPYPVPVTKRVRVPVPDPYIVQKKVPVFIKSNGQYNNHGHDLSLGEQESLQHGSSHKGFKHH